MPNPACILWSRAAGPSRLRPGDVHVWCAAIDDIAAKTGSLEHWLTDDERQRAQRLHFIRDRRRFITARCLLREILASYLAIPPEELRFAYGPAGKPRLAHPAAAGCELQFNLSHSGSLALYAVTWGGPVGVDLEEVLPLPAMVLMSRRLFRPAESDLLHRQGPDRQLETFYQLWTQKEALAKALGTGLAGMPVPAGDSPTRHRLVRPWMTIRLQPAVGFTGAIALATAHPRLQCRQWVTRLSAETLPHHLADSA